MKRRTFVQLSAAGIAALILPMLPRGTPELQQALLSDTLVSLCDERMILEIGKAYRRQVPSENRVGILRKLIAGDRTHVARSIPFTQTLAEKIKQEFATGRTAIVKGWILSVTEARQCALFSLT